jgi:mono/diheme cytochrome c family protein
MKLKSLNDFGFRGLRNLKSAVAWPLMALLAIAACSTLGLAQDKPEMSKAEITKQLGSVTKQVADASKAYKAGEFDACVELVKKSQAELIELAKLGDKMVTRRLEAPYKSIQRAHAMLELEGYTLDALPTWQEIVDGKIPDKPAAPAGGVSFSKKLAPWLVASCGRCHIDGSRGNFNMATFTVLMNGPAAGKVIFPGDPVGSRFVEVIESGDMPRGGGRISPEQLADLKAWISEGAKFDGPDANVNLKTLIPNGAAAANAAPTLVRATGSETVSFSNDIAPLLMENCKGCHINAMRASGNLTMDTFQQLLRGGDGGPIVIPGKPDDSVLIRMLKGIGGQRMPAGGRPPLADIDITKIATWIKEGAKFDGPEGNTPIEQVVNLAWMKKASHEDLMARRRERALAQWKLAMANETPNRAESGDIMVLSNIGDKATQRVMGIAEKALEQVNKYLKTERGQPLLKGGVIIYAFKQRYDYTEFGTMVEKRSLPTDWSNHWGGRVLDAYTAITYSQSASDAQIEGQLIQGMIGLSLSSLNGVPFWFSEGIARGAVSSLVGKDDPRVTQWNQGMLAAVRGAPSAKSVVDNQVGEEQAALIGLRVSMALTEPNRKMLDDFIKSLRQGTSFEATLQRLGTTPEKFLEAAGVGKGA